jgi:hypothetical protein
MIGIHDDRRKEGAIWPLLCQINGERQRYYLLVTV